MAVKALTLTVSIMLCLVLAQGQRPSYAGSRPPNGHKNKYRPTQSPETIELANRFGEDTLANGATQRPPQGVPVVIAEEVFVPIRNNQVQSTGTITLNNRINSDASTQNPAEVISSATSTTTVPPTRIPFDAHGDTQLIDHLNQIPIDNRPFWFINYQAIEAQRNGSVSNFGPIASRGSFSGK